MEPISIAGLVVVLAALVIVAGALLKSIGVIFDTIKGFAKLAWKVIKSPLKAISIIKAARLERKIRKTQKKLDKRLMKEDAKARLNAARKNPSYLVAKKVAPVATELEALKAKRK